jgi:hypothetical protein
VAGFNLSLVMHQLRNRNPMPHRLEFSYLYHGLLWKSNPTQARYKYLIINSLPCVKKSSSSPCDR